MSSLKNLDVEDDFSSSDDEMNPNVLISSKKQATQTFENQSDESDHEVVEDDDDGDENEQEDKDKKEGPENISKDQTESESVENHNTIENTSEEKNDTNEESINDEHTNEDKTAKLKKRLQLVNALKKTHHKTGVVYLSSIPPYMKPAKMRQILSKFGQIDRLFLKREDEHKYRQRIKSGGNKKNSYEEGWAEFIRKRDAKLCAETLNGNIIGGKKGTFYHDDILNVKYLPGFKWADLTQQIARENDIRQAKLEMEISQANKFNADFIRNVEKSKMLENMKNSKKRKQNQSDSNSEEKETSIEKNYRSFKQRKVATNRADAPDSIKKTESSKTLGNVLNNLL